MNTILIQASKDKATVQDDKGRFTNEVSQGIPVNVGDKISLEGIAINSTGVGSNIIEIPSKVKGFDYKANAIAVRFHPYINHNSEFTCLLPLSTMTATYNTATDATYGYLDRANALNQHTLQNVRTKLTGDERPGAQGNRFFLMGANINDDDGLFSQGFLPYQAWWKPQIMDMKLEVDIGYDSPQNLAKKLTEQLHKASASPFNKFGIGSGAMTTAELALNNAPQTTNAGTVIVECDQYAAASSVANTIVAPIQTRRVNYSVVGGAPLPTDDNNPNYSCFAAQNPMLWKYGTWLLTNGAKNLAYVNQNIGGAPHPPGLPTDIYLLQKFTIAPGPPPQSQLAEYEGILFNLDYNELNLAVLADFIHSQKRWSGATATTEGMKNKRNNHFWKSKITLGRLNDGLATYAAATAAGAGLQPNTWASPAPAYAAAAQPTLLDVYTYFFEEGWDNRVFSDSWEADGFLYNSGDEPLININGTLCNAKQVAQHYNCMFYPVRTTPNFTAAGPAEWCIALTAVEAIFPNKVFSERSYGLVDFAFYNPLNSCVAMFNQNVYYADPALPNTSTANMVNAIQVGAPNAAMIFDGDEGRFGWSNLHWATRVGSGASTAAVPSAPNIVFKMNCSRGTGNVAANNFAASASGGANAFPPFTNYAQSGIAIENIGYIKDELDGTQVVKWINKNQQGTDVEPDDFKISLFGRMGFKYTDLCSVYGNIYSYFNAALYNTDIATTLCNNFPQFLTTNPVFDTATAEGLSQNVSAQPMFDLGLQNKHLDIPLSTESCIIYARSLPNKLVFPYWLVYSDIIEGIEYHSVENGEKDNIIAVCNRAYISGDFAFSFATDYVFTATHNFVITGITTQILNPDLTPADIDEKTSVIYKIQKPIPMFVQNVEQNPPKKKEVKSDEKHIGDEPTKNEKY